jgi:pimeloyl-ACP methyl ester carboxylesterase
MSATTPAVAPRPPADAGAGDYGVRGRSEWLDIDWRQHLRSLSLHGSRVNYVEMGSGPPLVFIHGLAGCWQNWLENIPHFARSHRVVAVDLAGFGESDLPQEEISISGYGRFIDRFLGEVGIDRAPVVGNSMGGFISTETAISHPHRVERLVLVDAAGGPTLREWNDRHGALFARATRLFQPIVAASFARRKALVRRPGLRKLMLYKVATHPDLLAPELCYEVASGAGKPGFFDALKSIMEYDFSERIPQIRCPTLIVWGRDDEIVPVADALEYEALIPNARTVIFEDTGHVPMLERPGAFNRVLEEFLREHPDFA